MADTKTTGLTELASGATADTDVLPIVDVSDTTQGASGTLKKFSWGSLKATLKIYFDTLYTPPANTDALTEGSTNLYFTTGGVRGTVLTGLSTAAGTVVSATHTVLEAIGFLQKQVSDNTTALGNKAATGAIGSSGLTIGTGTLAGRSTAGTGAIEPITVGAGLTLSAGTLTAAGGTPGGSTTQVQFNDAGSLAGTADFLFDKTAKKITVGASFDAGRFNGDYSFLGGTLGTLFVANGGNIARTQNYGAKGFFVSSDSAIGFLDNTSSAFGVCDLDLRRVGARSVKITDGGGTNLGDLILRNVIGSGNLATGIVAKTAAYTVTNNDGALEGNATSGAVPFTLPALSGCTAGQEHQFVKTDSSGNAMTVDANASETINGSTSALSTTMQWGAFRIKVNSDKSGWLSF